MSLKDLHLKYRPSSLEEVYGHKAIVISLREALKREASHAYLFTGPSGVGKTTLARIVAESVGCESRNLLEFDAATHTGIDSMREIVAMTQYRAMGSTPVRVLVIDECHALSRQAWQSLLKSVEEPPEHLYWVFCTTLGSKVPKTIVTRCVCYDLSPLSFEDLADLLAAVSDSEGIRLSDDDLYLIASRSEGSPRRALTNLSRCAGLEDRKDILSVLTAETEDDFVIRLCRDLSGGKLTWNRFTASWPDLNELNPETVRRTLMAYITKVMLSQKEDRAAMLLNYLDNLDGAEVGSQTALLLALARCIFDQ